MNFKNVFEYFASDFKGVKSRGTVRVVNNISFIDTANRIDGKKGKKIKTQDEPVNQYLHNSVR